jgi:multidrug resistance efflux pump
MNRKIKIILIGGIGAWAVVAVLVDRALVAGRQMQQTNDAYVTADFSIAAPKASGLIDRVEIDDNDHVRAGQELAHIDDRDYRTALFNAEAALARAQADVEILSAQLSRRRRTPLAIAISRRVARSQSSSSNNRRHNCSRRSRPKSVTRRPPRRPSVRSPF